MSAMGRPTTYTPEIATAICGEIAAGRSLRAICETEGFPDPSTVYRWLAAHEAFREQYARAREDQADALFDDILEISDNATNDWMEQNDPDNPGWRLNGEHVQRSRLRVDSRKWMAARLKPKKYGDSTNLHTDGKLTIEIVTQGSQHGETDGG